MLWESMPLHLSELISAEIVSVLTLSVIHRWPPSQSESSPGSLAQRLLAALCNGEDGSCMNAQPSRWMKEIQLPLLLRQSLTQAPENDCTRFSILRQVRYPIPSVRLRRSGCNRMRVIARDWLRSFGLPSADASMAKRVWDR